MDKKSLKNKIEKIVNNQKITNSLVHLYDRWSCEKEYEDWNDYVKVMESLLPKDIKVFKGTKRPFGMKVKMDNINGHFFLKKKGSYMTFCFKQIVK